MNEQEAIEALLGEVMSEEVQNAPQDEAIEQEAGESTGQEEQGQAPTPQAQPNFNTAELAAAMAEAMKQAGLQQQTPSEPAAQTQEAEQPQGLNLAPEQLALLEQMGLQNLPQMQQQLNALMAQQAQAQERARQQQVFNQNSNSFEKEFPTIKLDELGKFAEANGFLSFLGEDYSGWRLVAKAMLNVATPTSEPDPITGNGGGKNEISAFEKLKKGESVSDIELGAELLKGL